MLIAEQGGEVGNREFLRKLHTVTKSNKSNKSNVIIPTSSLWVPFLHCPTEYIL